MDSIQFAYKMMEGRLLHYDKHEGRCIHKGEFKNGKPHGYGVISYPDGSKFEGDLDEGRPHGKGVISLGGNSYCVYEGDWKNGKRHGEGVYTVANGDSYIGQWRGGKRHGSGRFIRSVGNNEYDGDWQYDRMHGFGINRFENGDVFRGQWVDNRMSGIGKMVYSDGGTYKGKWKNGQRDGYGVLLEKNGDHWIGEWKDDQLSAGEKYSHIYMLHKKFMYDPAEKEVTQNRAERETDTMYWLNRIHYTVSQIFDNDEEIRSNNEMGLLQEFALSQMLNTVIRNIQKFQHAFDLKVEQESSKPRLTLVTT